MNNLKKTSQTKTVWPWQKKHGKKVPVKDHLTLEEIIGGNWLQKIGVLMVMIGVSYFLKYSFEQGWIGPVAQVSIGIVIGFLFLGAGEFFEKKYTTWAHILTGAGIGILYFSLFAARDRFGLFSDVTTFISMIPVTLGAGYLSIRYNSLPLAIIGIVGGFLAPILMGSTNPNHILNVSYSLILSLGVFGIAFFKPWRILEFFAFFFCITYWEQGFGVIPLTLSLGLLAVFFLMFSFLSFYPQVVKKTVVSPWSLCLIVLSGIFTYSYLYQLLDSNINQLTVSLSVMSLFYLIEMLIAYHKNQKDRTLMYVLLSSSIVTLTTILPIQTDGYPLTVALLLETIAVFWIGFKLKIVWLRWFGMALGTIGLFYIFENINVIDFHETPVLLNGPSSILALGTLIYSGIAWMYHSNKKTITGSEVHLEAGAILFANWTLLLLFTLQASHFLELNGLTDSIVEFTVLGFISALYGVFLFLQGYRLGVRALNYVGFFLLGLALIFLYGGVSKLFDDPTLFMSLNHVLVLLSHLLLATCIQCVKRLEPSHPKKKTALATAFNLSTVALFFILINIEINLFFEFQSSLTLLKTASFSIAWTLFSISSLIFGIIKRERLYRLIGLIGFGLTVLKVFTVDIMELSSIYRVVALITLGVLMIVASYLYQRFKKVIRETII